jgi:hypothetical protein
MTKVMLIAGVAALAIAAPAAAGPHGGHGGGNGGGQHAQRGGGGAPHGGGGRAFSAPRQSHGGGPRMEAYHGRPSFAAPRMQARQRVAVEHGRGGHGFAMQRQAMQRQRGEQKQARAVQMRRSEQRQAHAMQARRNDQRQAHAMQMRRNEQRQARVMQMRNAHQQQAHVMQQRREQQARLFQRRNQQQQARMFEQQMRGNREQQRRALANDRMMQMQQMRDMARSDRRSDRFAMRQYARNDFAGRYANGGRGWTDGCPPGLAAKHNGCLPPGQAMKLLGSPLSRAASYATFAALPESLRYMYPETPDRYYRYGDGYLYGVNRSSDVIDSILPLFGGGYLPGMTFPATYMNSYVPDYYGMSSFYPDTDYADYRYLDGNVYSVDPYSGMIEDVIPTYAYGYGVGQMLPASYGYYNVPQQYRSVYYDTPDYNYWYAPGAIYQVDPRSQLITSVASLLSPGFTVGQPLPLGYDTYNVPMAYRATYYDTPNAWYRYNNGYIYQVDPATQLVTAIVASLLT